LEAITGKTEDNTKRVDTEDRIQRRGSYLQIRVRKGNSAGGEIGGNRANRNRASWEMR